MTDSMVYSFTCKRHFGRSDGDHLVSVPFVVSIFCCSFAYVGFIAFACNSASG